MMRMSAVKAVGGALCALPLAAQLAGCAWPGVEAGSTFNCDRARGLPCTSLSDVEALRQTGRLHVSAEAPLVDRNEAAPQATASLVRERARAGAADRPARLPETLLRVWVASWTDDTGAWHAPSVVYVPVAPARWAGERWRTQASRRAAFVHAAAADETPETGDAPESAEALDAYAKSVSAMKDALRHGLAGEAQP